MALHPSLRDGQAAWQRREWRQAAAAWSQAANGLSGQRAVAAGALAELAAALDQLGGDDPAAGAARLEGARVELAGLPEGTLGLDLAALVAGLERPPEELPAHPPPLSRRRLLPRGTVRFLLLVSLLAAAALALRFTPLRELLDGDALVGLLLELREAWWAPLALIAGYAAIAPLGLPISPLMVAGGIVFGTAWGTLYNVIGATLGGVIGYQLALLLGRDFVAAIAGKRLRPVERFMARHGFWGLVGVRFLPIPFVVVNFGAAFARVPFSRFLASLLIGLPPSLFIWTWFAASAFEAARGGPGASIGGLIGALAGMLALSLAPPLWQQRQRRRRYQKIRRERAPRRG